MLSGIGKNQVPQVRCVIHLANRDAGRPCRWLRRRRRSANDDRVTRCRQWPAIFALGLGIALKTSTGAEPPARIVESPDKKYAAAAATLEKQGADFDAVFQTLCQTALAECDRNPKLRLDDQMRAMFGGLWRWGLKGGHPKFQGMADKALHFIGGGAFQGYWDAGRAAAVVKEELDRRDPQNFFDLDDMAATMIGARWMDLATTDDPKQNRRWVELWATGRCTLSASLPKLEFGRMKSGAEAPPEIIRTIQDGITAAMKPPGPGPAPATPP